MNPTSLEYLYQIAPPVPDRAPSPSRSDSDSTGFDDHLSQAASTVFDVLRSPNRPSPRPSYSPTNQSTAEKDDSAPSSSSTRPPIAKPPQKDKPTNDTRAQDNTNAPSDKPRGTSRDDNKQDDNRDKDKSDDTQVASVAGAPQPAAKDATSSTDKTAKDAEQGAADQAKDKIAAADLSKVPSTETNAQTAVDTKAADGTGEATAELKANVETAKTGQDSGTDTKSAAVVTSDKAEAATKTAKTASRAGKANAASTANDLAHSASPVTKADTTATATSGATPSAAESTAATAQAIADAKQSAAQSATTPDSAAVGQSNHSHKDAASDNAPTEAAAATNAANITTAVANVTAPSPVDAIADKAKTPDDDATKPIAEKTDTTIGSLGRTLRTDLSGSSKTSNTSETSPVDAARFVSRVAKAIQTANDRDGTVQLRLSPPELGSLKIQLTVKDGVLSAAVEADNSNARRMLLDHLPALRDRLAGQNIRVDRFDVDVKQENNGGQPNPRGSNQNPYQQQAQETESRRTAAKTPQVSDATPVEPTVVASRLSSTGINLVI
jgi:flagellar hook-length control protein FliK